MPICPSCGFVGEEDDFDAAVKQERRVEIIIDKLNIIEKKLDAISTYMDILLRKSGNHVRTELDNMRDELDDFQHAIIRGQELEEQLKK